MAFKAVRRGNSRDYCRDERQVAWCDPRIKWLFRSAKAAVLTVPSVHRLVKGWCGAIRLKGNYGSHTLRKTWGYHQRVTFDVGLPELMVAFNHSTQRQTLDYLCVQPEELKNIYQNEL